MEKHLQIDKGCFQQMRNKLNEQIEIYIFNNTTIFIF